MSDIADEYGTSALKAFSRAVWVLSDQIGADRARSVLLGYAVLLEGILSVEETENPPA